MVFNLAQTESRGNPPFVLTVDIPQPGIPDVVPPHGSLLPSLRKSTVRIFPCWPISVIAFIFKSMKQASPCTGIPMPGNRPGRSASVKNGFSGTLGGFSLIEILVVVSIVAAITAATLPAFNQLIFGSNLIVSGELLRDNLTLARQTSLTRNRPVEVRFYKLQGSNASSPEYQALQLFIQNPNGIYEALTKVIYFRKSIILSTDTELSSLFDTNKLKTAIGEGGTADFKLPGVGTDYEYLAFNFKPDGGTNLSQVKPQDCYVTLVSNTAVTADGQAPSNFVTVQIDPVVGKISVLRP